MSVEARSTIDAYAERIGRWTAARTTRRSLLGKLGKFAVFVAAGPTIATLLADPAEARACGQSGTAPRCPTYDCDGGQFGWCWYATGCCAGGALKKICDCCVVDYPFAHGYCPPGSNVKCMVESCGSDPRVQSVAILPVGGDDLASTAAAVRAARFPNGARVAVLIGVEDPWYRSVAMPVGAVVGGAVFFVGRGRLDPAVLAEIQRLGSRLVVVADPWIPPDVDQTLADHGIDTTRVGSAGDVETFSTEVAAWSRRTTGFDRALCVTRDGLSGQALTVAAALATAKGYPLLVGADSATTAADQAASEGTTVTTYLVGPEAAAHAADVPGARSVSGRTLMELATALVTLGRTTEPVSTTELILASWDHPGLLALAGLRRPLLLHEHGTLGTSLDWLAGNRAGLAAVYLGGGPGRLETASYHALQAVLNGYETQLLVGGEGDGLIYSQPAAEQPAGMARPGSAPPPPGPGRPPPGSGRRR